MRGAVIYASCAPQDMSLLDSSPLMLEEILYQTVVF